MTLFFDTKVQFLDSEAVSTISLWHNLESVFAVASYSQNRGGSVTIFDEQVRFFSSKLPSHLIQQLQSNPRENPFAMSPTQCTRSPRQPPWRGTPKRHSW